MTAAFLRRIPSRYWDVLWAFLALTLALDVISALSRQDALEAVLFFSIHLVTAVLFLVRNPAKEQLPNPKAYVIAMLSTLYVYLYTTDTQGPVLLSGVGNALVSVGSGLCLVATLSLGRCFSVLPSSRGVQTRYLYGLVRHPIYGSYILMDIGILCRHPVGSNLLLFLVGVGLFLVRIHYEELLLPRIRTYREYSNSVKYRILPFIY